MTDEVKHTPGSWFAERCEVTPCWHIEAGAYPFGTSVCEIAETPRVGSAKANAHLISAAPELLEALRPFAEAAEQFDARGRIKAVRNEWNAYPSGLTVEDFRRARDLLKTLEGSE